MAKIHRLVPPCSGHKVIRALKKAGFAPVGQTGSHIKLSKMERDGKKRVVIVPDHPEIAKGTLASILRQAGLSKEAFGELLN